MPAPTPGLGREIQRLRVATEMTVDELSKRAGMRTAYLTAIEDDTEEPSAAALARLARELEPAGASYAHLASMLAQAEFDPAAEAADDRKVDALVQLAGNQDAESRTWDRNEGRRGGLENGALAQRPAHEPAIVLQLERAEFDDASGAAPCALCGQPLAGSYFQANGRTVCPRCGERLRDALKGGTGWSRALSATAAGLAAAAGGSILYYLVLAATGIQFGLIAIVIGVVVGKAVSWGSRGRGGWRYQTLAMVLTYLSIVSSYLPAIVREIANARSTATAQAVTSGGTAEPAGGAPAAGQGVGTRPPTLAGALVAVVLVVLFVCALPFLMGVSNIMGLAIIAIGVYEAWKFNRRRSYDITGPHAIKPSTLAPESV